MITNRIIPKLNFSIPQLVNPYIEKSSKQFADRLANIPVRPKAKVVGNVRKVLNNEVSLSRQPMSDAVELSKKPKQPTKSTKSNKHTQGKTIKNVLAKYFDNEQNLLIDDLKEVQEAKQAKQANLNQIVKSYEQESQGKSKIKDLRIESLKLMKKDALLRIMEESMGV